MFRARVRARCGNRSRDYTRKRDEYVRMYGHACIACISDKCLFMRHYNRLHAVTNMGFVSYKYEMVL